MTLWKIMCRRRRQVPRGHQRGAQHDIGDVGYGRVGQPQLEVLLAQSHAGPIEDVATQKTSAMVCAQEPSRRSARSSTS
jgi:hypothetical protein